MSDPRLDFSDWFAAIVAGMIAGVGAAMGWFTTSKRRIYERITKVEEDMGEAVEKIEATTSELSKGHTAHAIQLSVLTTCQANIEARLTELKQEAENQSNKLDQILHNWSRYKDDPKGSGAP